MEMKTLGRGYLLLVLGLLIHQASITARSQSTNALSSKRWEKLIYEDPKAVIQETTAELGKNPNNLTALRMRSS